MSIFKIDKYSDLKKELNKLSDAIGKASKVVGDFSWNDDARRAMKSKGNSANSSCSIHFTKSLGYASRLFPEYRNELE